MPSPTLTLGSFLVAIMVGLTGMGGGALLTPMLMLVFGVPPLAAVSSDLVVSAITKPVGALVHLRRGSVNLRLAGWLTIGSVPSAFLGGLLGWWIGPGSTAQVVTERATGAVLLIAAAGITAKTVLIPLVRGQRGPEQAGGTGSDRTRSDRTGSDRTGSDRTGSDRARVQAAARTAGADLRTPAAARPRRPDADWTDNAVNVQPRTADSREAGAGSNGQLRVRKIPTLLIGILVGLAVGVTSTGSGTLVIAALTVLYPALPARRLVGTDLAQAVPMVLAAALAHLVAGDVHMSVTTPLLIGGIPGVIIGSLLSSRARGAWLRPVLAVVVLASGLSLVGLSPQGLAVTVAAIITVLVAGVLVSRQRRLSGQRDTAQQRPATDLD
jgi:uncharacterized protein